MKKLWKFLNKKRAFRQELHPGIMLPPFYGVAYRDYMKDRFIAYPVPFHIIIGLSRYFYSNIRWCWKYIAFSPHDAYNQGWGNGYRAALKQLGDSQ